MRFMVLVKGNDISESGALPSEKILAEMGKYNEELAKAGVLLSAEGLHPSFKGARVKFSGNKRFVVDGPFTESKELIAGFWIFETKSLQEAIDWVKRAPCPFEGESEVEIRQIFEAADFGANLTPELSAQEERIRKQLDASSERSASKNGSDAYSSDKGEKVSKQEEAHLILKLYELRREETMRKARDWYFRDFNPKSIADFTGAMFSEQSGYLRMVVSYWDMATALVHSGAISLELFNETNGEHWPVFAKLEPLLGEVRQFAPQFAVNMEKLVDATPDGRKRVQEVRQRMSEIRQQMESRREAAAARN